MAANDDLTWNTTRCNRLLRPLSSKLTKLRKELDRPRSAGGERRNPVNATIAKASPRQATFVQPARKPRGFEKRKDPDWMPDAGPGGKKKHTYRGRGGRKPQGVTQVGTDSHDGARPGQIAFTPFIARTGGRFQETPQLQRSPLRKFAKYRGPLIARVEHIQELKKQMPAGTGNLANGLIEAYANLLQATSTGEEKKWKGTRSLLGSCLRKMPEYIKLEEYFAELDKEEEDEDEDREISQEVYAHLEQQFEIIPGQGWRPFKQIVRAHGTALICDAFVDQILGIEVLNVLLSHCLNASAWDEAEKILWAFLPSLKPLSIPNSLYANLFDEQCSIYMWMVKDLVDRTGRHRFLFDALEYMISQELLPLEWLATESMRPTWDRLVRTLSDGDHRTLENAFRFLETSIFAGIGLPDESLFDEGEVDTVARQFKPSSRQEFRNALNTTFSSLLTVLCSIALVNHNRDDTLGEEAVHRITWLLDSIVVGLLKRNEIQDDLALLLPIAEYMQDFAQRATWAVFASFVIHLEGCRVDETIISIDVPTSVRAISWILSQYPSKHIDTSAILATLSEFISSASRGTGRIWQDDGFDQIQRLTNNMLLLSGLRLPHMLWTMKRLALESVMEFAHTTSGAKHMAYAREIEKAMRTKGHVVISHSPQKDESPSTAGGFRWEEGIGEWVACTPFIKQGVRRTPRKPVRALELLPTPEPSGDNASDMEDLPLNDNFLWDTIISKDEDEDVSFPQSSPVKKAPRVSASSLGKRTRASSPMVVIPAKRSCITPPDSPVVFYPELPQERVVDGPRRSRRSRKDVNALVSALRSRHSRSSLDKGLRNLERKTYEEVVNIDTNSDDTETDEESDPNTSFSSMSSGRSQASVKQTRQTIALLDRKSKSNSGFDDADERDELSKTPGVKRRHSGRRKVRGLREWWKVGGGIVAEDESDDELSFH